MPPSQLAYILAPSHSGSTLLALLLATHPDVTTVGELNVSAIDDVDTYVCSCGARLDRCEFWQHITARMADNGIAFDVRYARTDFRAAGGWLTRRLLRPLHRGPVLERIRDRALAASPAWRAACASVQRRNAALVSAVCAETGARIVVDSSKLGLRLKFLLRNPDLDVRVIRLIRDGRAVAVSYVDPAAFADARDPGRRGGGSGGNRDAERLGMREAAREWRRSQEEAAAIVRTLDPARWIEIRYEALCLDTDATLRRLFGFLGLRPDAPRADLRRGARHVIGNGMRLDTTTDVRLDTRWTALFTPEARRRFEPVAGRLNRRLGYSDGASQ